MVYLVLMWQLPLEMGASAQQVTLQKGHQRVK